MSKWKLMLGLCMLLVGAMVTFNSLAQAEEGAEWFYEGKELKTFKGLNPEVKAELVPPSDGALLMEFGNRTVRLLCTFLLVQNTSFGPGGIVLTGATIIGKGCKTILGQLNAKKEVIEEKESKACEPISGAEKGVIKSAKLKGSLALHEGTTTAIIEPESSETLATVVFGEECAVGEKIPLFGKLHLKDANNKATTELVEHVVEQGPLTELYTVEKAVHLEAKVDGSVGLRLAGADAGKLWSGKAN